MKIFPIFSTFAVLIAGQDTKTVVFPPTSGNGSSLGMESKIEPVLQSDMTRAILATLAPPPPSPQPQPQPMLPSDYFFPIPQRAFLHHRSENIPYGYEYPNVAYPVAQSIEHSIGPSSKQLVIVSFIGLLLLLAIIQNTLSAVKRKDAIMDLLSSRQKRDVYVTHDFRSVTPEEEEILNSDARVRCIQRTICLENRKLFRDLGAPGKMLAKYLTKNIEKSFKLSSGWDRLVRDAGAAGIRGENCDVLYRDCEIPVTKKRHKNVLTNITNNNFNSTH
ncbi:uncharacterized protein [Mycetomoellerius zeteki]|uniref:uncharacterized protein n=1 Tax=Mycetomoellerius zeteki TaxID=64791 RepID=UPI00084EAEFF|nr:PREDICTED: uncharacterized protein LOC108720757 [Trachymyrmex zeteki]